MPDSDTPQTTAMVRREPDVVTIRARPEYFRQRLSGSRQRLDEALRQLKERARAQSPATRIRREPYAWAGGALLVGVVLGWLTAPRR